MITNLNDIAGGRVTMPGSAQFRDALVKLTGDVHSTLQYEYGLEGILKK